ncbi:protein translocase, SecG subunit [Thermanaerovibrio velox DSM 12556]|uniref:Protein-export membrane protein SecG n=1 Tax=Thermanaerovibrio velox DSM 12556 TaxID=926567 RepID=H0UNS7_9BACT|nr:preprotein translocase subunit SecG [Thermanaerovibrio velox]EHM09413.1 protein translocase, SecG subunit [Thermanaerovibrio velox DSM 12556]
MKVLLVLLQLVVCVALGGSILMQQRKNGGFAGMFGGGTQQDNSGAWQRMSGLTKISAVLMGLFMLLSLVLVAIS